MNTTTEFIVNDYVFEIIVNDLIDLGPVPQMIRAPSYDVYEEVQLISDGSFQDFQNTPNDFEMPTPCENCYIISCNGECCQETELIPRQLSFEEEMDLPPSPALTRIHTNAHLPDDYPEDEEEMDLPPPQPLRRMLTNAHLPPDEPEYDSMELSPPQPLRRMLTNAHLPDDEPEDEDNFDVPEGTQYIGLQTTVHSYELDEAFTNQMNENSTS